MSHKTKTNRHFNKRDYIVLIILITLTLVWSLLTSQASAQVSTLQNNCFGTGGLSAGLTTFLNSKFVSTWTNQNKCQGDIAVSVTAAGDLLSGNVFNTVLATGFANLTLLETLRLDSGGFTGSIPAPWSGLVNLEELGLANNNLKQEIPEPIRYLTSLKKLYMNNNELDGPIPEWLTGFVNLQ